MNGVISHKVRGSWSSWHLGKIHHVELQHIMYNEYRQLLSYLATAPYSPTRSLAAYSCFLDQLLTWHSTTETSNPIKPNTSITAFKTLRMIVSFVKVGTLLVTATSQVLCVTTRTLTATKALEQFDIVTTFTLDRDTLYHRHSMCNDSDSHGH